MERILSRTSCPVLHLHYYFQNFDFILWFRRILNSWICVIVLISIDGVLDYLTLSIGNLSLQRWRLLCFLLEFRPVSKWSLIQECSKEPLCRICHKREVESLFGLNFCCWTIDHSEATLFGSFTLSSACSLVSFLCFILLFCVDFECVSFGWYGWAGFKPWLVSILGTFVSYGWYGWAGFKPWLVSIFSTFASFGWCC